MKIPSTTTIVIMIYTTVNRSFSFLKFMDINYLKPKSVSYNKYETIEKDI